MTDYRKKLDKLFLVYGCTLYKEGASDRKYDCFINKRGVGFSVGKVITTRDVANDVLKCAGINYRF
jgi:hypothetical protein